MRRSYNLAAKVNLWNKSDIRIRQFYEMRLFKRRTSGDLEDPQLTGLRFESAHNQGETKFLSQNSSLDTCDNISIATAPTPEPRLIMSHSPRSLKKLSTGKLQFIDYGFEFFTMYVCKYVWHSTNSYQTKKLDS